MKISAYILIFVSALMLGLNASAELNNHRSALIIGISEYGYADVSRLDGVAKDMESATKIALAMGITAQNIRYIRNSEATKANILKNIEKLSVEQQDARAFIYFSGHGTRGYDPAVKGCVEGLLTYEGQVITHHELALALNDLSQTSDKVIVMLDACHSKGVINSSTRSLLSPTSSSLTPKFAIKSGAENAMCSQPSNFRTRGLLNEVTRLGGIQENFVQIAAAREDEVSFDQADAGGLATQGVRDCMLGKAVDIDRSGAVSLEEVRQCAQGFINRVTSASNVQPHHITVKGNRNLIPVRIQKPIEEPPTQQPVAVQPVAVQPVAVQPVAVQPVAVQPVAVQPVQEPVIQSIKIDHVEKPTESIVLETTNENKSIASLATLRDIESQRNPKRILDVKLAKPVLKIGKDSLDLKIKSNRDGYLYLVLLGSDARSFYILFPNGLDGDNQVKAGKTVSIPKPDWQIMANGPAGIDHILVMVSDSPRKLDTLLMSAPSTAEPFTYALNDIGGRSALIDFLIGSSLGSKSESFGAKIVSIKEIQ